MKKTIGFSEFCDSFSEQYQGNFSYEGKRALFDYLEEYEKDTGEDVELDTIALCCEYTEYDSLEELQKNYTDIESMEDLQDHTQVIEVNDDRIIIQDF